MKAELTAKRPWLMPLVRRYARRRLRGAFEVGLVSGLGPARTLVAERPVIVAANHVCYWDAFVATLLDGELAADGFALMDAANLRRLWFFGAIGALPLRRDSARDAHADMVAAGSRLSAAGRVLWIFPQGTQRPAHLRPLGLASGVAWLAQRVGALTVPLSISYLYREAPVPALFTRFGAPIAPSRTAPFLAELEDALIDGLRRNDEAATTGASDYAPLWPPARRATMPASGRLLARERERPRA